MEKKKKNEGEVMADQKSQKSQNYGCQKCQKSNSQNLSLFFFLGK